VSAAGLKVLDPICVHCGESIGQLNNDDVWYHDIDSGPDRRRACICHCLDGDGCIDGEVAEPACEVEPRGLDMIPEVEL
jgi:hypothetical protein